MTTQSETYELPFLFVHGPTLWKVVLATLTLATLGALALVRGWLARCRARNEVAWTGRSLSTLAPGNVVLRGRLHGAAQTITDGQKRTSTRSDGLWFECEGTRLELSGQVEVVVGSRARIASWLRGTVRREVRDGDEVIVSGNVERRATSSMYREDGGMWSISDAHVMATVPMARALPQNLGIVACLAFLFGAAWYGVMLKVGDMALESAETSKDPLSALGPVAIAGLMPDSREALLERWDLTRLLRRYPQSEARLAFEIELERRQGTCPIYQLTQLGRFEAAAALAFRCSDRGTAAWYLAAAGWYAQARTALPTNERPVLATSLALAAGDWNEAASGAERLARKIESEDLVSAQTVRCEAALFRWFGGDTAAFSKLSGVEGNLVCGAIESLTLSPEVHVERVAALGHDLFGASRILGALGSTTGHPELMRHLDGASSESPHAWLAPHLPTLEGDGPVQLEVDALHRRHALLRGDFRAARDGLNEETLQRGSWRWSLLFESLLREGASIPYRPPSDMFLWGLSDQVALRRGELIQSSRTGNLGTEILMEARAGNDTRLQEDALRSVSSAELLAVAPYLRAHRSEIAALQRLRPNHELERLRPDFMFTVSKQAAEARDLARLLGDEEEAQRWQALFERHAAVLADKQRLIALLLWTSR